MLENIEYSEEWLNQEILRVFWEEKKTGKKRVAKVNYIDLLKIFKEFIKLNKE